MAPSEALNPRYVVQVEQGPPRGDLYELEQVTYFRVIDTRTGERIMTFRGDMEAGLSTDGEGWSDYSYAGVKKVLIASDQKAVCVQYHDGRAERVPLP